MKLIRTALALAVIGGFVLAALTSDVVAGGAKEKKTAGKLVKLDLKDDGTGTINIESKKKDDPEVKKATFKVTKETKVFKAGEKKGDKATPAEFKDLKEGQFVIVGAAEGAADTAVSITIGAGKKPGAN